MTTEIFKQPKITKQYIIDNLFTSKGYLNGNKTRNIRESSLELYFIFHNLSEAPKCECGKDNIFKGFAKGFTTYCSHKCSANSLQVQANRKITCKKLYGVENVFQSEIIKEKNRMTMMDLYGVEYPGQSEEIKKQIKLVIIDKYGVENPSQAKEVKQKKIQTCLNNHGVKYPSQSREIKEKQIQTCLNNHGVKYPSQSGEIQEKTKQTCLKRYGVEYISQAGINTNSGYKHKPYTFPSGKIVKVQGYEPQLLDELVLVYKEAEILTDRKDMPEFWYFTEDSKKHRYFPDVYIPKDNLIYEVKSSWTLEQTKKNGIYDLKKQSVIDSGFQFKLKVY